MLFGGAEGVGGGTGEVRVDYTRRNRSQSGLENRWWNLEEMGTELGAF